MLLSPAPLVLIGVDLSISKLCIDPLGASVRKFTSKSKDQIRPHVANKLSASGHAR